MQVRSDTALATTTTEIADQVTFDVTKLPNGITYKGLKAVLSFADPIEWNQASSYDALTVVYDEASFASYASKRPVPTGITLDNEIYWLRIADGNAQIESYRQHVEQLQNSYDELSDLTYNYPLNLAEIVAKQEDISSLIEDGSSIYVPTGTYTIDFTIAHQNVTVYGEGSIDGTITIDVPSTNDAHEINNIKIRGIKFTGMHENAILINRCRGAIIDTVTIDGNFTYGVNMASAQSYAQAIAKIIIQNCHIKSATNIYANNSLLAVGDLNIVNNEMQCTIDNIHLNGCDGITITNNVLFMPGYAESSQTKNSNIYLHNSLQGCISNNKLFESGGPSIELYSVQNINVSNNQIIFPNQRLAANGAIYIHDGIPYTTTSYYQNCIFNGNTVFQGASHGFNAALSTGFNSIHGNRFLDCGNSSHYYGSDKPSSIYGINYPELSPQMYTNTANNVTTGINGQNNLSSLITNVNNITQTS